MISRILRTAATLALACTIVSAFLCRLRRRRPSLLHHLCEHCCAGLHLHRLRTRASRRRPCSIAFGYQRTGAARIAVASSFGRPTLRRRPPASSSASRRSSSGEAHLQSSCADPDGSANDGGSGRFHARPTQAIGEVRWRGGYDPARLGSGGPVMISRLPFILPTRPAPSRTYAVRPLVHYQVGGNAGETPAGVLGRRKDI